MNEVPLYVASWMFLIYDLTYKVGKLIAQSSSFLNR